MPGTLLSHAGLKSLDDSVRALIAPIAPVVVFGPNNFPFAVNGISGGFSGCDCCW